MVALAHPLPPRRPHLARWADALWYLAQALSRPKTRADCADMARPCPWVSCRYHRLVSVNEQGTLYTIGIRSPGRGISKGLMERTQDDTWIARAARLVANADADTSCVLDIADAGELSQEDTAELMDTTAHHLYRIERSGREQVEEQLIELGITSPWTDEPEMTYPEGDEDE